MASPYYVYSGATGAANGSSWTDAYTSLANLFTGQALAGGDIIYIASDHNNSSYAASKSFLFPESSNSTSSHCYLISTNRGTNLPEAGAIEQTNGNYSITLEGRVVVYGVTFKTGDGTSQSGADLNIGATTSTYGKNIFINCTFHVNSISTSAILSINNISTVGLTLCDSCTFKTPSTSISILSKIEFINCNLSDTPPTTVFSTSVSYSVNIELNGCDFSGATNLITGSNLLVVVAANNCFLPSTLVTSPVGRAGTDLIECHACGIGDHNYYYLKTSNEGTVTESVSVYLTTGGSTIKDNDGSLTPYSLSMVSDAHTYDNSMANPLYSPWFYVPVFSTGSKTFIMKIAHTLAAVLKDNEVWLEVEYMGGVAPANTPRTAREYSAPLISGTAFIDYLATGSNLTDTSEAWTGITSEKTHTLSKTVTIDEQGYARVRVAFAKSNSTIYLNADVTVS